jgi:hypothetical protein
MEDQKLVQVDLGFTKFNVHKQAIIAFVLAIIIVVIAIGIVSYPLLKMMSPVMRAMMIGLYAIIAIGLAIYIAYIVNCLIVGKCVKLSWIIVSLYVLTCIVYIGRAIKFYQTYADAPVYYSPIKESSRSKK